MKCHYEGMSYFPVEQNRSGLAVREFPEEHERVAGHIGIELRGATRDADCVVLVLSVWWSWSLSSFWLTQAALHPGVAAVTVLSLLAGLRLIPVSSFNTKVACFVLFVFWWSPGLSMCFLLLARGSCICCCVF